MRDFLKVFLVLLPGLVLGQQNVEFNAAAFPDSTKKLNEVKKIIIRGNTHLDNNDYVQALENYKQAQLFNPNNALLNFKLGLCYFNTDKDSMARLAFEKALLLEKDVVSDIEYYVAVTNHLTGAYDNAITHYELEKTIALANNDSSYVEQLNKRIQECNSANTLLPNTNKKVQAYNLGDSLNSKYNENSMYLVNDTLMYVTSQNMTKQGQTSEDIYYTLQKDSVWSSLINIGKPINTYGNDAVVGLANNGQKMYIYADVQGGDIYYTEKKNGVWTKPKVFGDSINTMHMESSICFSSDLTRAYFVSNREGSLGDKDIYYVTKKDIGWSAPVNLGSIVNTPYDEESLFLNGDTMYFASRGHNSVGGYDVFKTYQEKGSWVKPINLGFPINSPYDDINYFRYKKHQYLISDRSGGKGGTDLYEIDFTRAVKDSLLAAYRDSVKAAQDSIMAWNALSDEEKKVQEKLNNLKGNESIDLKELIDIKPIYFDFDDYSINNHSAKELEKVKELLISNPKVKLEVGVHTDCRGRSKYNQMLSEKRAESIVRYLTIENTIDPGRISGYGFGEEHLVVDCNCDDPDSKQACTEADHEQNRRADFKVGL